MTRQARAPGGKGEAPLHGPGGRRSFEKPKNARRVALRLAGYLAARKLALAVVLLLVIVNSACMLAGNYALKPLINDYILPGDFAGLGRGLLALAAIYAVGAAAAYGQSRIMIQVAQRTGNTLRRELFVKLQGLPLAYSDRHPHGELMSRFTNDIDNVQMAFEQSTVQLVSGTLTFVGAIVMMFVLSPILMLVTGTVLIVMVFVMGRIGGRSRTYFQAQQASLGDVNGYIEELVEGLKVVKVFGRESEAVSEFKVRNEAYRQAGTNANFYAGILFPIVGNLNNIAYASTAMVGGLLAVWGRFDIGSLAAYLQYSRQVGMPVQQLSNQLNTMLAALAGAERVFEVMDEPPESGAGQVRLVGVRRQPDGSLEALRDGQHPTHWAWLRPVGDGRVEYVELRGDVRFEGVSFSYVPGEPVLHDISLYARPGEKIALVGSTGAGKTTLANLVQRFYEVEDGRITLDGIDIRDIRQPDLRNSIGMVLQDTHLFSDTVMENIRYGRLEATDEECVQAARQANADSFIRRLPQGYDTYITADGGSLSQGQRQLLAIARTAVADPPVMILDEATSSIDTRTEQLIEQGMDALMHGRTVFVIAHRLSTVRNADAIIVIEEGRIVERGNHDELIAAGGRYAELYSGQFELD